MTFNEADLGHLHETRREVWKKRLQLAMLSVAASIPLATVVAIAATILTTKQVCGL